MNVGREIERRAKEKINEYLADLDECSEKLAPVVGQVAKYAAHVVESSMLSDEDIHAPQVLLDAMIKNLASASQAIAIKQVHLIIEDVLDEVLMFMEDLAREALTNAFSKV